MLGIFYVNSFILISRAVIGVAKLVIQGISLLTSFVLSLSVLLVAKLVISDILSSIFLIQHQFLLQLVIYFDQ